MIIQKARELLAKHYRERDGAAGEGYVQCLLRGDYDTAPDIRAVIEALASPKEE